jgi:hypothetical protein
MWPDGTEEETTEVDSESKKQKKERIKSSIEFLKQLTDG